MQKWAKSGHTIQRYPHGTPAYPSRRKTEKHHTRVDPYENDAAAKAAGCYQLVVGEGLGNSQIAVHANASQTSHRNALEYRDDVAEHLTGEGVLGHQLGNGAGKGWEPGNLAPPADRVGHSLDEVTGGVVV